ncbi:somatostatin receptor type 2-like [Asterias amurensis]|uniref:somatostatin receptor type 2-like n=1 Tax=Asterias amurensis TaxID=7602 RepID=UPI003AB411E9
MYSSTSSTVLLYMEEITSSLGFIGNLLVSVTILRTKSLHNLTNYLILNLAIVDSLYLLSTTFDPWVKWTNTESNNTDENENTTMNVGHVTLQLLMHVQYSLIGTSTCSIALVTFECYMGIVYPLQHMSYFIKWKVALLLLTVWIVPFILELPATIVYIFFLPSTQYTVYPTAMNQPWLWLFPIISSGVLYLVPVGALIGMYARILQNLKLHARIFRRQGIIGPPQELSRAHHRVARTLILVTAACIILISPTKIICLYLTAQAPRSSPASKQVLLQLSFLLSAANSAINPILYALKYKPMRRAFRGMICPCVGSRSVESSESGSEMQTKVLKSQEKSTS